MSQAPRLSVYFDGSCPLCRREIALYQRNRLAHQLAWVGVGLGAQAGELGGGLGCTQAMARFHVRDAQGRLFGGAAGFSQLWLALPGWRWLGWLSAWPPLSWGFEGLYRLFLPLRPSLQRGLTRWLGAAP